MWAEHQQKLIMKEISDIVYAYEGTLVAGKQMALATVVHLEGSSYRRPGARMLITDDGQLTGAISGGCLEGDALLKAQMVIAKKESRVVTYDTMDDDDSVLAVGLGCNGIIRILIEPVDTTNQFNQISFLKKLISGRTKSVLVTLFTTDQRNTVQRGTSFLLNEKGFFESTINDPELQQLISEDAEKVLSEEKSAFKKYISKAGEQIAFIEFIPPAISLIIFGAGNDVVPLVKQAELIGWETTVLDGRASYARKERFTPACQVRVTKPDSALDQIVIDERMAFLLMTHNYQYDKIILKTLAGKNISYLGMLGPSKKLERMSDELKQEGIVFSKEFLSVVHSPVGLDISAETPEEIALSILSEIQTVINSGSGISLRNRKAEIHSRSGLLIEERRQS